MRDRRKDGQLIKRAIKKVLHEDDTVRVQSGKGTACCWWHIYIDSKAAPDCSCTYEPIGTRNTCRPCKNKWHLISKQAEAATISSGADISHYYSDGPEANRINSILVQVDLHQPETQGATQ